MEGASNTPSANSEQTVPGRQGDACLQSQQVFEPACSGKGIGCYFVWGRLSLYSDTAGVDLIALIRNDK